MPRINNINSESSENIHQGGGYQHGLSSATCEINDERNAHAESNNDEILLS